MYILTESIPIYSKGDTWLKRPVGSYPEGVRLYVISHTNGSSLVTQVKGREDIAVRIRIDLSKMKYIES